MRIALIAEHFPPLRSSCAVQMQDLARELHDQGYEVTVITPVQSLAERWSIEDSGGVRVVRLKAFETRDRNYAIRMLGELAMPLLMLRNWRASPMADELFDGIAWYSPHIFFGPLVAALKKRSDCPAYLILRDIFPEWAADVGVIGKGPAFRFLQQVARYQYRVADIIGVQTPANLEFFAGDIAHGKRVEVLQNWMRDPQNADCSIDLSAGPLAGRRICVYAGNMGVAQGMDRLLDLAVSMKDDPNVGFAFVGRGSEVERLKQRVDDEALMNTMFFGEIPPDEIPGLYLQAHVGLVALDPRHRWHNIPGKFISYMHAGLPVLAAVNPGNDLVGMIREAKVGAVTVGPATDDLVELMPQFADREAWVEMSGNAKKLAHSLFSSHSAARQIVGSIKNSTN